MPTKPKKFKAPTVEEAIAYGDTIGLPPQESRKAFLYHTSKGWKVGRCPMVNWHAAWATWKLRWEEFSGVKKNEGTGGGGGGSARALTDHSAEGIAKRKEEASQRAAALRAKMRGKHSQPLLNL